jgi:hypothetical protein
MLEYAARARTIEHVHGALFTGVEARRAGRQRNRIRESSQASLIQHRGTVSEDGQRIFRMNENVTADDRIELPRLPL